MASVIRGTPSNAGRRGCMLLLGGALVLILVVLVLGAVL